MLNKGAESTPYRYILYGLLLGQTNGRHQGSNGGCSLPSIMVDQSMQKYLVIFNRKYLFSL